VRIQAGRAILLPSDLQLPLSCAEITAGGGGDDRGDPGERAALDGGKRRATLVASILKGETSPQEAARKHGLTVPEIEEWKEKFLLGAENALRTRAKDEEAMKDRQIKQLKKKVGELVLDMDILKEA